MGSIGELDNTERVLKTDLRQYAQRRGTDGPYQDGLDIDCLVIVRQAKGLKASRRPLSPVRISETLLTGNCLGRRFQWSIPTLRAQEARLFDCPVRCRQKLRWDMAMELLSWRACGFSSANL